MVMFVLNTEFCGKYELNPLLRNIDNFKIMDPLFRIRLKGCVSCVCKILSLAQIWLVGWLFDFDGKKGVELFVLNPLVAHMHHHYYYLQKLPFN